MVVSGPIFEPQESELWRSLCGAGAHYNIFVIKPEQGMAALRWMFPDGEADDLNFVLFSTSGVHGSYCTIEEVEASATTDEPIGGVTFLIIQPRLVCMRYGECTPKTKDDYDFLKKLRKSSLDECSKIGLPS